MSIADKLTKIRTAIKAIKQAIINKGQTPSGDITTYPDAISNITSGGTTIKNQDKTITSNGSYTADDGYTGLGTVTVNTPEIKNTTLTVTPKITAQTLTPSSSYTGYSKVTVNAVTSSIDSNITAANIKKGTTILGVTGTLESSGGTQYIGREVVNGELSYSTNSTFTLPSDITTVGGGALNHILWNSADVATVDLSNIKYISTGGLSSAFEGCMFLTSVNLSSLTSVDQSGLTSAFTECSHLTSVDLSSLVDVSRYGLNGTFKDCPELISVDLSSLASVGAYGLEYCFDGCQILKELKFPALISKSLIYNNCFYSMLYGVTGCTVHFPSNLESVIGSWSDVTSGFGGTNTTVLFDLPATT